MNTAARLFSEYLEQKNIKYDVIDDDFISIKYHGKNAPSISIDFIFDNDGKSVAVRSFSIAKIPEEKYTAACVVCSELNNEYRWTKFYLDADNELAAAMDALIDPYTTGQECFALLLRNIRIIDEAYPNIMRMLWG